MLILLPLPAFQDNYLWLAHRPGRSDALVVDPGDANVVLDGLQQHGLRLTAILVTHHHGDHVGGVTALKTATGATVYAPADGPFRDFNIGLRDGDRFTVAELDLTIDVLATPGHTLDHLCYHLPAEQVLFCGDTLFSGGCGRLFEGSPAQMYASLRRLQELPADTRICCAHEYTEANLRFARHVLPDDPAIRTRQAEVQALRQHQQPSLPSNLAAETASNPFLRSNEAGLATALSRLSGQAVAPGLEAFTCLRQLKDGFRG